LICDHSKSLDISLSHHDNSNQAVGQIITLTFAEGLVEKLLAPHDGVHYSAVMLLLVAHQFMAPVDKGTGALQTRFCSCYFD
jgi:hypothetical protein